MYPNDLLGRQRMDKRKLITGLLWDVGLPAVVFYVCRALDFDVMLALAASGLAALIRVGCVAAVRRWLDGLAALVGVSFVLLLVVSLLTEDPRILLVRESILSGAVGLLLVGSCAIGWPILYTFVRRLNAGKEELLAQWDERWRTQPSLRRHFVMLSMVIGVCCSPGPPSGCCSSTSCPSTSWQACRRRCTSAPSRCWSAGRCGTAAGADAPWHPETSLRRRSRSGPMRGKGIHYDTGTHLSDGWTREAFDSSTVRREMQVIAGDLHCTAVRITGSDPDRLTIAGEHAAEAGLEVWFAPFPRDLTADLAVRARRLDPLRLRRGRRLPRGAQRRHLPRGDP
jgi:hypothetical protein